MTYIAWRLRAGSFLLLTLFMSACGSTRPPPTLTPSKTLPPHVTPSDTPVPTATASETPTAVPNPTVTPTPTPIPTATPFQVSDAGVVAYQVAADSNESIVAVEFRPNQPEILVSLNSGADARAIRVRWSDQIVRVSTLPGALTGAHYSPDGTRLLADGLIIRDSTDDVATPQVLTTHDGGAAWSPDGLSVALIRAAADDAHGCEKEPAGNCTALIRRDVVRGKDTIVLTAPFLGGSPLWSPDWAHPAVVLQQGGEGGSSLVVADMTTNTLTVLVPNNGTPDEARLYSGAVWAADGRSVIYTVDGGGVWQQPIAGGAPTLLAAIGRSPYSPPGSHSVYYFAPLTATPITTATVDPNVAATLTPEPPQTVWRLDLSDPKQAAQRVFDTPVTCTLSAWSVNADTLACVGTVDGRPAIRLYAIPAPPSKLPPLKGVALTGLYPYSRHEKKDRIS